MKKSDFCAWDLDLNQSVLNLILFKLKYMLELELPETLLGQF